MKAPRTNRRVLNAKGRNEMADLFSLKNRMNRALYARSVLAILAITFGMALVVGAILGLAGADPNAAMPLGILIGFAGDIVIGFQAVKRLHDLDRPGSHVWLLFVPFYSLYLMYLLFFRKGTEGTNRYGVDPRAPAESPATATVAA
jgi:uncharacterized membrane protein YhaH (DUF805 family)